MLAFISRFFFRRDQYSALVNNANQPECVNIPKIGDVHIVPMDPGMRLALADVSKEEGHNVLSIYLWLISVCVEEFKGRNAAQIGIDIRSPEVINALGEAVLDVSGISTKGQDKRIKKSETAQS